MEIVSVVILGLFAGWLVNLIADTVPDRRSLWTNGAQPFARLIFKHGYSTSGMVRTDQIVSDVWRHWLVWVSALVLGGLAYLKWGISLTGLLVCIQAWFFLAIAVIDLEYRLVLNRMLLPALPLVIACVVLLGQPTLWHSILGAVTGFAFFLLLAIVGGMGMGDVKLAGLIGLATGLQGVIVAVFFCIFSGGIVAFIVLARSRFRRGKTMAYAPYLVLGAWVALYYRADVWQFYLERL